MVRPQPRDVNQQGNRRSFPTRPFYLAVSCLLFIDGIKDLVTGAIKLFDGTDKLAILLVAILASATFYTGWLSFHWVKSAAEHGRGKLANLLLGLPALLLVLSLGISGVALFTADTVFDEWYRISLACSSFVMAGVLMGLDDDTMVVLRGLRSRAS
jgi:hypothetical protein